MKFLKLLGHLIIMLVLTVLTQVGGFVWAMALVISIRFKKKKRFVFPILYLAFNLIIIPPVASAFGREKLPVFDDYLKPRHLVYPLLFRNYVNPDLKELLINTSRPSQFNESKITYLDANFPFIDGFPLLPHLSHSDGKKIDISFMYLDKDGKKTDEKPSISGYGIYVDPVGNSTSKLCISKGYWQYDLPKYLTFGKLNDLNLDKMGTQQLLHMLLNSEKTDKIFIEPYLKQSLGLSKANKIRFHGCQAVRHDDHIHLQIK